LYDTGAQQDKLGGRAVEGLVEPVGGVVGKASAEAARATKTGELIAAIPGVGGRDAGIGEQGEVAVQVITQAGVAEGELLISGIVAGRSNGGGQVGAGDLIEGGLS
jgi:hypothetical protein